MYVSIFLTSCILILTRYHSSRGLAKVDKETESVLNFVIVLFKRCTFNVASVCLRVDFHCRQTWARHFDFLHIRVKKTEIPICLNRAVTTVVFYGKELMFGGTRSTVMAAQL